MQPLQHPWLISNAIPTLINRVQVNLKSGHLQSENIQSQNANIFKIPAKAVHKFLKFEFKAVVHRAFLIKFCGFCSCFAL